jgi:diguanylate cyclase (GGDEF)-like protein
MTTTVALGSDLVPVGRRWLSLLAVRAACAAVTIASLRVLPGLAGAQDHALTVISIAYVGAAAVVEVVRSAAGGRWLGLLRASVVVDALYLALVVNATGGTSSALGFLVYLHIVAVTLVVSYRRGLEAAVAQAALVFISSSALGARYLDGMLWSAPSGAALRATSYLIVAVAAAALASVDERALNRSRAHVQAQLDLAAELHAAVHPQPTAVVLAGHLVERLGYQRAVVLGVGATGRCEGAVRGPDQRVLVDRVNRSIDQIAAGLGTLALRRNLDLDVLDRLLPDAENVVVLRMEADGRTVGVLAAEWGHGKRARIPADVVDATTQSAGYAALALHAATLLAASQLRADHDELTGLANRSSLHEALSREMARTERRRGVLSLALFDLDHFKEVNDAYGHAAGDDVLRLAARTLEREARQGDLCARLHGDEFAVLLPDCSPRDALDVVARVVRVLGEELGPHRVTVSAGVASYPGHDTPTGLMRAADVALYNSKEAGRNRATAADPVVIDLGVADGDPTQVTPA